MRTALSESWMRENCLSSLMSGGVETEPRPRDDATAPHLDSQRAPCKGVGLQWVQLPPGNWVAPAGSYRSGGGGNEAVGAFETHVSLRRCSEQAGRNASERRAGLETSNVCADLALAWGRPKPLASMETVGIDRPTSDPTQRATGVMTTACLYTEIQRNTGNPER